MQESIARLQKWTIHVFLSCLKIIGIFNEEIYFKNEEPYLNCDENPTRFIEKT